MLIEPRIVFPPPLNKAHVGKLFADPVHHHQKHDVHRRVEQPNRGGKAVHGFQHALFVHIGGDDFGSFLVQARLQQIRLFEPHVHQVSELHDQLDDDDRNQLRHVDVQNPLPGAGPVHPGRFMQGSVHAGKGGQIDDGSPSCVLPDAGGDVNRPEGRRGIDEVHRFLRSESLGNHVDQPPIRGKENPQHTAQDHDGNEVRRINDRLRNPLELFGLHLIDEQRQDDGNRKSP